MSKRAKKSVARARVLRSMRSETLEDRVVLSADPIGGPTLGLHGGGFMEEDPAMVAPALGQHGMSLGHHDLLLEAPSLGHHTIDESLGGLLSNSPIEATPAHDPNADFWTNVDVDMGIDLSDDLGGRIEQTLSNAHDQTGQDQVVSKYGFDGAGQTVAVIDSGIAWSHTALGGGLGSSYRVVGGWDFTENDADPYDDGPEGSHGTHVAGIIGATDATHSGVASGVDLVGLRVFDDAGNGYFSWVEQALDWVHANKNAFDNPITAVNLSLGAEWNSHSLPGWAMLEDEFAQLEADGIFISVSAGNSFTNYNEAGVSYPAASDHVIPVMSVDDNGSLSYFSQRADYAIAAPGRGIISTVPDYIAGDADTIDDDWASFSGTSMAAPYVAGASVLVREAMEFVGMTDIDQWDIYSHMMSTGDQFYDSATNDTYTRLNLESAIDALMPTDDYGSSMGTAYDLGTINDLQSQSQMSGVISTLDDLDYFTFTAGATGTVTFTASAQTHSMEADWSGWGGGNWTVDGDSCSMDVVAGQSYTVSLASADGLGYYDLSVDLESVFEFTDWGAASIQQTQSGLNVDGEQWFRVTTAQAGLFTAQAQLQSGSATVAIYDSNLASLAAAGARADATVTQGQELYIQVLGTGASLDVGLTNAVSTSGSTVTLTGTTGDDSVTFAAGATEHVLSLNGVEYSFDASSLSDFALDGGGGSDVLSMTGSTGDDVASLGAATTILTDGVYSLTATGFYDVTAVGNGGHDIANLIGTTSNDTFRAYSFTAVLVGGGQSSRATDFDVVTAFADQGGTDLAFMYDSSGDDDLTAEHNQVTMTGVGFQNVARGFESTLAWSLFGGQDTASFVGTSGDDVFEAGSGGATLSGSGYRNEARGFDETTADGGSGGNDRAFLYDSTGNDELRMYKNAATMFGVGFTNRALGFNDVTGYALRGGVDRANVYDSSGDDDLMAEHDRVTMTGAGFQNVARGFESTLSWSLFGGQDTASFVGTSGDDVFEAGSGGATLSGSGYRNEARGFDETTADGGSGGNDRAFLYDSTGNDELRMYKNAATMFGVGFTNRALGFNDVTGYALRGGVDRANVYDSSGDDDLTAEHDRVTMTGAGFQNVARGFESTLAWSLFGGQDTATFVGTSGDDVFEAGSGGATLSGSGYRNEARGFDETTADGGGGNDLAFLYDSSDDDTLQTSGSMAILEGSNFSNEVNGFDTVKAYSVRGGNDIANLAAIDFALEQYGVWV